MITTLWYLDKHLTGYKSSQRDSFYLYWMEENHCKLHSAHQALLSHTDTKLSLLPWQKGKIFSIDLCTTIDIWYAIYPPHMLIR